ncbi:unnamed protein product [Boreogadus saida]
MMNPAAVYPHPPGNPIGMPVYPQGMAQPPFAIPGFVAAPIYQPGPAQPQFQSPVQQQPVSQNTAVNVNSPVATTSHGFVAAPIYQPGPAQPQFQSPVVVLGLALGATPIRIKCAFCHATCVTNVTYKNGALTWVLFSVLGILGVWPCCLIPFCCDICKDVEHRCPNCQNVVYVHHRLN